MRIQVVSWNIDKRTEPWRELERMARDGEADLALLQEAGRPPEDAVDRVDYEDRVFWSRHLYDRWPLVVRLSDRIAVEPYRQVPPRGDLAEGQIGVSGIGTLAAARVIPHDSEAGAFVAVSVYARWLTLHPSANGSGIYADASAHRILSDLSALICHANIEHRILAAGDLNMFYGATGTRLSMPERERTVWDRMKALGLEFLGPQAPHGRSAESAPDDVPGDTKNVPTYYHSGGPEAAVNQLDYAFASRGFHKSVSVRAMNDAAEWGSSDHCRLMIEVDTKGSQS
ncbi:MAG: hypothetical protein OXG72_02325 [Acidobacteria bacterium]|nr:hypothetical protein [Acidobacteriota bacterium]